MPAGNCERLLVWARTRQAEAFCPGRRRFGDGSGVIALIGIIRLFRKFPFLVWRDFCSLRNTHTVIGRQKGTGRMCQVFP